MQCKIWFIIIKKKIKVKSNAKESNEREPNLSLQELGNTDLFYDLTFGFGTNVRYKGECLCIPLRYTRHKL